MWSKHALLKFALQIERYCSWIRCREKAAEVVWRVEYDEVDLSETRSGTRSPRVRLLVHPEEERSCMQSWNPSATCSLTGRAPVHCFFSDVCSEPVTVRCQFTRVRAEGKCSKRIRLVLLFFNTRQTHREFLKESLTHSKCGGASRPFSRPRIQAELDSAGAPA